LLSVLLPQYYDLWFQIKIITALRMPANQTDNM